MRSLRATSVLALALLAGCGGGSATAPAGGTAAAERPRDAGGKRLPPELAALTDQAGELLDGGVPAFEQRLRSLRGHPVVVNKWASWCAPCRAEFPYFQSQAEERAGEVAFLGVDAMDADSDAAEFLRELPVPYPSYRDPDLRISEAMRAVAAFPSTAFYDRDGKLAYLKQGGYGTEQDLAADIERYALGRG